MTAKDVLKKILITVLYYFLFSFFVNFSIRITGNFHVSAAISAFVLMLVTFGLRADRKKYKDVETEERKRYYASMKNRFTYIVKSKRFLLDVIFGPLTVAVYFVVLCADNDSFKLFPLYFIAFSVLYIIVDILIWFFAYNKVYYIASE